MLPETLIALVGAAAIAGAVYDLATLTIPNWISLALLALFPVLALFAGLGAGEMGIHLLIGIAALAAGIALFAGGIIGGGDAKLFAALALYMGLQSIGSYLLAVAFAGGVLAGCLLVLRSLPVQIMLSRLPWAQRLVSPGAGVPYGVAIAAGALAVLPMTQIFALANAITH